MRRLLPAAAITVVTVAILLPPVLSVPQHGDEAHYGWSAAYYGGRLARLDLSPQGTDLYSDPAWSPFGYWALTQPMGARLIYAVTLGLTRQPAPTAMYNFGRPLAEQPAAVLTPAALLALRLAASLCAALGLGLIAWRLGWPGAAAGLLLLLIPHVPADLARAWAEAPLLLGFGLAVATFGTRWFGAACGVAAAMKLTALLLWPLLLWRRAAGSRRWGVLGSIVSAILVWILLTPPSWFLGGPFFLAVMLNNRRGEQALLSSQAAIKGDEVLAGLFVPTRYWIPLELALLLLGACLIPRLWRDWSRARRLFSEGSAGREIDVDSRHR